MALPIGQSPTNECRNAMLILVRRIVGISTVFLAALLSDRAFSLRFDTPLPAEVLAASPFIDWAYPLGDAQRHPIYGNTSIPIENLNIYNAGPWETLNMLNEKAKKWRDTDGLAKVSSMTLRRSGSHSAT